MLTKEQAVENLLRQYSRGQEVVENNKDYFGERPKDHWMDQEEWDEERELLEIEQENMEAYKMAIISLDPSYSDSEKFDNKIKELIRKTSGVDYLDEPGEIEKEILNLLPTDLDKYKLSSEENESLPNPLEEESEDEDEYHYCEEVYRYQDRIFVVIDQGDIPFEDFTEDFQKALKDIIINNKK